MNNLKIFENGEEKEINLFKWFLTTTKAQLVSSQLNHVYLNMESVPF